MPDETNKENDLEQQTEETSASASEKPEETDVIGFDLCGYPYNKKYPPNVDLYGRQYDGYSSPFRETLFYRFAVSTMIWNFHIVTNATIACPNQITSPCVIAISA